MPNSPAESDELHGLDVVKCGPDADDQQQHRRNDKAHFESVEQRAIAVGANHAGKVVAHRTKCADKKEDILSAPARLGGRENWNHQQRRGDKSNKSRQRSRIHGEVGRLAAACGCTAAGEGEGTDLRSWRADCRRALRGAIACLVAISVLIEYSRTRRKFSSDGESAVARPHRAGEFIIVSLVPFCLCNP